METNPHERSTAAVILTRDDAHAPAGSADPLPPRRKARRWPIVLIWTILGSAIAALWALLLLGDSLSVNG